MIEAFKFQFTGEEKFRIKVFYAADLEQAFKLADEYLSRNNAYDDWEHIPFTATFPKP